jgi:tyrosyl-tRNA synthetase
MSISDRLMLDYYDLLSAGEWDELAPQRAAIGRGEGDPLAFKHALAARIVERFQGADRAIAAAERFKRIVQRREIPEEIPALEIASEGRSVGLLEGLVKAGMAGSNGEARRLVAQGGVQVDGQRVVDPRMGLEPGGPYLIQVGKRRFIRLQVV